MRENMQPTKKRMPTADITPQAFKLEVIRPVLWHIQHITVLDRREKAALPCMLESNPPNLIANIFKKGSTMTDMQKLEARINSLEAEIELMGKALTKLTAQHQALFECTVQVIARPDFLKNAPKLFATAVYDLINLAVEDKEIPEACKQAAREETDAFFSRLNDLKRLV